jgi:transglutaminase-like putative cysteine protease
VAHFPEIEFSTGASWHAMAAEYAEIVDRRADPAAVQEIVDKLIAGKTGVAEKEGAILDYLDREVRYTGIEFGEAALMPHDPADTLSRKYGDCKDKATLLATMLRAAGIPAYVALLNAGSWMDVPADLNLRSCHRLCAGESKAQRARAMDRRHRPLCAPGPVTG